MKLTKIIMTIGVIALAGCTTTSAQYAKQERSKPHRDIGYVQAVENAAARQGVDVIWINTPSLGPGRIH